MPIIIPPSKIYSYEWQPVRDNAINCIEVGVKRPEPDNQFNISVHNQKCDLTSKYVGSSTQDYNLFEVESGIDVFWNAVAGIQMIPTYVNATITIPLNRQMQKVNKLNLGVDKNGNDQIGLRLYGTVNTGTVTNTLTYTGKKGNNSSTLSFNWGNTVYTQQETNQQDYTLQKTQEYSRHNNGSGSLSGTAHIELTLNSLDNLSSNTTVNYVGDNAVIDLIILCGLKITKLGSAFKWQQYGSDPDTVTRPMDGTYEEYIPSLCEVTIYGNTIGIKLVDDIIKIGGNDGYSRTARTPQVKTNQLVAQYTIDLTDKAKTSTQTISKAQVAKASAPTLKSWNDYYDDETEKETYKYKLEQAQPKLNEFYEKHNFPISFAEYRTYQKEIEEIVGFKYERLLAPIVQESVDLADKYIGNSKEEYKVVETENEKSVVGIQFIPTYVNKTIQIPTFIDNEEVIQWVIGTPSKSENGEQDKDVTVRLYGTVNKGKATNTLTHNGNEISFNWADTEYEQEETNEEDYYYLDTTQNYSLDNGAMIELQLDNEDNYVTVNSHKTKDYVTTVDLTVLCGLKVIKLGATLNSNDTTTMNGTYEEFIPSICEITIFGNTVAVKL